MEKVESDKKTNVIENEANNIPETSPRTKMKARGKKRKRKGSDSSSESEEILPENAFEVEKSVIASAVKNNLDDVSVKKILKKVVTNDHVLALVKLREEEEESSTEENKLRPKLTRAKAKELMKVAPKSAPWNLELTPIKHIPVKTRPEVTALIAQELPEDEDDEEYEPTHDDVPSDDDQTLESCSDLDSQPRTPATPRSETKTSPKVIKDGPFKVPQAVTPARRKLKQEGDATIALRTRSKLCLSETPIEHIHSSLAPPEPKDVTPARRKLDLEEEATIALRTRSKLCLSETPIEHIDSSLAPPEPKDVTPARRKLNLEEEATIALRTRSKLCLSETPIEHIESSFVPPDDLPVPVVDDQLWNEFLNECLNPASVSKNEDDDETDPEYNVAADPDAPDDDDELERSIIKISKKELNDLVTELFNIMPEQPVDDELADLSGEVLNESQTSTRWEGKQEKHSDDEASVKMVDRIVFEQKIVTTKLSVGKLEPSSPHNSDEREQNEVATTDKQDEEMVQTKLCIVVQQQQPSNVVDICVEEHQVETQVPPPPSVKQQQPQAHRLQVTLQGDCVILPEQVLILQQQLRMHIQLATSNFLQLYVHPIHWSYGPIYREYLENLSKMVDSNPKSVVNVCNLQPALELVKSWAETVSEDTPENAELVEFMQKEAERSRRRYANNNTYVGDFPATLLRVVANSAAFVYPHLLPPLPYRPDRARRFMYMPSEDAYIAHGLEEFWEYIEANPELYKRPARYSSKHRWGSQVVAELVVRHMMPWMTPTMLLGHMNQARKSGERDNPIRKFFQDGFAPPVKHRLLAFNPKLTLYEQPEYEMPRKWLRYLAKTSKRFRLYLRRRTSEIGHEARGVDIDVGIPTIPTKEARHVDVTPNLTPAANPELSDKFDITINTYPKTTTPQVSGNLFKLVETSSGINLIPLEMITKESFKVMTLEPLTTNVNTQENVAQVRTNTVDCNVTPICSTVEMKSPVQTAQAIENHCKCCVIMRRYFKPRQKNITEYFRSNKHRIEPCRCKNRKYPKITNKLKLLVSRFQRKASSIFKDLKQKIELLEADIIQHKEDDGSCKEDLDIVTEFHIKLLYRAVTAKNLQLKRKIQSLFEKFDTNHDDPIQLAKELESVCDTELVDIFKEFLVFLTPEQADKMTMFRDYFALNCAPGLVKKIDEHVKSKDQKLKILGQLSRLFAGPWTACQMCGVLLVNMRGHLELAEYTFDQFPHWSRKEMIPPTPLPAQIKPPPCVTSTPQEIEDADDHSDDKLTIVGNGDRRQSTIEYEADNSSSGEEDCCDSDTATKTPIPISTDNNNKTELPSEHYPLPRIIACKTERDDSDSEMSMMIMSEDESVKNEPPEWKRDEDKLILEVLKMNLTPEERKDTNKSIYDILEEKQVLDTLTENLVSKSTQEVKDRMMYLLNMLVIRET